MVWIKCLKTGYQTSGDFCLKQGQGLRGQARTPHQRIYQVSPSPPSPGDLGVHFNLFSNNLNVSQHHFLLIIGYNYDQDKAQKYNKKFIFNIHCRL